MGKHKPKVKRICKTCKKVFWVRAFIIRINGRKYCSYKCYWKTLKGRRGKVCAHWKDGITSSRGYVSIYKPKHPFCNHRRYIRRSHLIMEKMIGRYLKPKEQVHHKGIKYPIGSIENKQDDRPINLKLFKNNSEHISYHWKFHRNNYLLNR